MFYVILWQVIYFVDEILSYSRNNANLNTREYIVVYKDQAKANEEIYNMIDEIKGLGYVESATIGYTLKYDIENTIGSKEVFGSATLYWTN